LLVSEMILTVRGDNIALGVGDSTEMNIYGRRVRIKVKSAYNIEVSFQMYTKRGKRYKDILKKRQAFGNENLKVKFKKSSLDVLAVDKAL